MDKPEFENAPLSSFIIPHDAFYIAPRPLTSSSLFYAINRAGITARTPADFSISRHSSYPFNVIHCVTAGCGQVTFRGKVHAVARGQLFVLPAYEAHSYCSCAENPMGLVWVEFCGGDSDKLTKHILDLREPVVGGSTFQEVLNLCTSLFYRNSCHDVNTSLILYQMLIALSNPASDIFADQDQINQAVFSFIDAHLSDELTLAHVAATFGYHPNYFSARFTKIVGLCFSQYVLQRRMSHACQLLLTTNEPLERIAQSLCFYDVSHFIRRFKETQGITPAHYRKENLGLAPLCKK
ncbi:MAG: AraC family transcriptional regulator [Ruthenibacterium sp.]